MELGLTNKERSGMNCMIDRILVGREAKRHG